MDLNIVSVPWMLFDLLLTPPAHTHPRSLSHLLPHCTEAGLLHSRVEFSVLPQLQVPVTQVQSSKLHFLTMTALVSLPGLSEDLGRAHFCFPL